MSDFIVGLTGGIGSGKSTVADEFAARGVAVVDTDVIAHALTGPGGDAMAAVREAFGASVLRADGALDRMAMRALVFSDPAARVRLEGILHPLIRQRSSEACRLAASPYVLLAVPLLVESGTYRRRCDRVLVVDCPEELQVRRVMARSALAEPEVKAIMATQAGRAERRAAADDILINDGDFSKVRDQVSALHEAYLSAARKKLQANY